MERVFEDEFMDLHASIISLCKELVEYGPEVDMIYAYCSIEGRTYTFDVFYTAQGKAITLKELNVPDSTKWQFLKIGVQETVKIGGLCKEFERPVPTEIKMIYNMKTQEFTSDYQYESQETDEINTDDIFDDWIKEIDPTYGEEAPLAAHSQEKQEPVQQAPAPVEEPQKKRGFRFPFFGKGKK